MHPFTYLLSYLLTVLAWFHFQCLCIVSIVSFPLLTYLRSYCFSSPCHHGSVCVYLGVCTCRDVVLTCGNHDEICQRAECLRRSPDCQVRERSYTCDCSGTGYAGDLCEMDVNECAGEDGPSYCQHGGRCRNTQGSAVCNCSRTGFIGSRCQVDVDECRARGGDTPVCYNDGQCCWDIYFIHRHT